SFGRTPTPSYHEAEAIAWHWLGFMGLADKAHVLAKSLPLGERKRLEMARALATQPQLLLLDEAIAGLNPTEVGQIMDLIRALQVNEGEIVTLLGANGAGKTTTLHTISGLLRPRQGSVMFQGQALHRESPQGIVEAGLIHIAEGRELFPHMTVLENLELGAFS